MLLPSCAKFYLIEVEMEEKRKLVILGGEEESDDTCKRRRNPYLEEKRNLMILVSEGETHTWKRRGSWYSLREKRKLILGSKVVFLKRFYSVLWISVHCSLWQRGGEEMGREAVMELTARGFMFPILWNFGGRNPCGSLTRVTKYGRNFLKRATQPQLLLQIQ